MWVLYCAVHRNQPNPTPAVTIVAGYALCIVCLMRVEFGTKDFTEPGEARVIGNILAAQGEEKHRREQEGATA